MPPRKFPRPAAERPITADAPRVTAISIDGNSIAAVAMSFDGVSYRAEAIHHLELDRLVEVSKKLRHPVFMDVTCCVYPEKELIQARLADIFQRAVFHNPAVVLLAPDKSFAVEIAGDSAEASMLARRRACVEMQLPINPYDYPCALLFQEVPLGDGQSLTRSVRVRLADVYQISQLVAPLAPRFRGCVIGEAAASAVLSTIEPVDGDLPVTLCDVGKLRTLYAARLPNGQRFFHAIPVGLARDDMHYFRSISPSTDKLMEMNRALGTLFLPPDTTPSPLFSGWASSPQIDCTRLAVQIARYAQRAFESSLGAFRDHDRFRAINYLSGRAARIPGLKQFMEAKLDAEYRWIDGPFSSAVSLAEGYGWDEASDNLLAFGAAMQAHSPVAGSFLPLTMEFQTPPMKGAKVAVGDMREGAMYVFEQKTLPA